MVNREVVGPHYGLRDWLLQRITAVIMVFYTLILLSALYAMPTFDYMNWKALWQSSVMRYSSFLFVLALAFHAWIGVRNIFMDYIKVASLRLVLYVVVILALCSYFAWAVQILWGR